MSLPRLTGFSTILPSPAPAAVVSSLVVHAIVRKAPPRSIRGIVAMLLLPPILLTLWSRPSGIFDMLACFSGSAAIYLTSLTLSVLAYRLSPLHPLASYPGPVAARATRLWACLKSKRGEQHWYSHELFQRYGNVVRTGPNHLIIRDADAIPIVLGMRAGWHKGDNYQTTLPLGTTGSLALLTDPVEHAPRRKLWDRAFTPTALRAYEPLIHKRITQLCQALESHAGESVDLGDWMGRATFDMMGDFGYGGAFELMADGDPAGFVRIVGDGFAALDVWGTVSWVRPLLKLLPADNAKIFFTTALEVAERRQAAGSKIHDLFFYLMDSAEFDSVTLAAEAAMALIAGSGGVSATLLNTIFYLLAHPSVLQKLRAELDTAVEPGTVEIERGVLAQLPYLRAVLDETLRLQPPLANDSQRTPPPGSGPVVVAGHVIPPGTTVHIPVWSIHRDERYFFPDPDVFWPERWMPEGKTIAEARGEEFRLDQRAYHPYSYGQMNCAGRPLAQVEMRMVIATLLLRFDVRFADGFDQQQWLDGLTDRFSLGTDGSLRIVVEKRS